MLAKRRWTYGNGKHNFLFGAAHAANLASKCVADKIQSAA